MKGGPLDDLAAAVWGGGAKQTLLGASVNVYREAFVVGRYLQAAVLHVPVVLSGQVQLSEPQAPRAGALQQRVRQCISEKRLVGKVTTGRRTPQEGDLIQAASGAPHAHPPHGTVLGVPHNPGAATTTPSSSSAAAPAPAAACKVLELRAQAQAHELQTLHQPTGGFGGAPALA